MQKASTKAVQTLPRCSVLQLATEIAPGYICNRPCQLMKHVPALVGDMLMEPGRLQPCLPSPLVSLCFSGELLLETSKFLQSSGKLLGVEIDGSVR